MHLYYYTNNVDSNRLLKLIIKINILVNLRQIIFDINGFKISSWCNYLIFIELLFQRHIKSHWMVSIKEAVFSFLNSAVLYDINTYYCKYCKSKRVFKNKHDKIEQQ